MDVPKLGKLRQLPQSENASEGRKSSKGEGESPGATIAFVALSAIALAALLMAGYAGIRWTMVEADVTTETYLVDMEEEYSRVDAAVLIREFENMEKFSLDLIHPYQFHEKVLEKRRWGWNAVTAGCVALVSGCVGLFSATRSRR